MSFCMTFLSIFDIPVFWPILLIYFIVLMVSFRLKSACGVVQSSGGFGPVFCFGLLQQVGSRNTSVIFSRSWPLIGRFVVSLIG